MRKPRTPAKQVALLVAVAVVGLLALLFAELVIVSGFGGVALFVGLLAAIVLVVAVTSLSLEAVFTVVAYVLGYVRATASRVGSALRFRR